MLRNNIIKFVISSAQLLQIENIPSSIVYHRPFAPKSTLPMDAIRAHWMPVAPNARNVVRESVFRGLTFPHEPIVNMAAFVFAPASAGECSNSFRTPSCLLATAPTRSRRRPALL
jgi:hypothetical protein